MPLSAEIAVRASDLENLADDPIDRVFVATALVANAVLLPADDARLTLPGPLKRQDAQCWEDQCLCGCGCVGSTQYTASGFSTGSMSMLMAIASLSERTSTHSSGSVSDALISWCGT